MLRTHGLKHLGLALLFVGACSAGKQNAATGIDFDPAGYDGFDETHFDLLTAKCALDGSGNMTVTVGASETAYVFKRADGFVVANAMNGSAECAMDPTKKITINGTDTAGATNEKVIIDFYSGIFGLSSKPDPNSPETPSIVVNLGGTGDADTLKIRGTPFVDTFTLGTKDATTSLAAFQVAPAKARTLPDLSMAGVENVVVSTGAGNDTITAQGGTVLGGTAAPAAPLASAINIMFYGGDDNDTLISGAAYVSGSSNVLKGGAGHDYFPQQVLAARDNIYGEAGIDTVDYSVRTAPLRVTVGVVTPATNATGSITPKLKAALVDNDYFELNDGENPVVRFAYQTSPTVATAASVAITVTGTEAAAETVTVTDGADHEVTFCYGAAGDCGTDVPVALGTGGTAEENAVVTATNLQAAIVANAGILTALSVARNVAVVTVTNTIAGVSAVFGVDETSASTIVTTPGVDAFVLSDDNEGAQVIDVSAAADLAAVATATRGAINNVAITLNITAAAPDAEQKIALTADETGAFANLPILASANLAANVEGMSGGGGLDDGQDGEGDSIEDCVENVVGGEGADTIDASAAAAAGHVLMGMGGNDTLTGSDLVDFLYGGLGNDTLISGAEADSLFGGTGNDVLRGGTGNDTINGGGVNCVAKASNMTLAFETIPLPIVPFVNATKCTSSVATAPADPGIDTLDYSERTTKVTVDLTLANLTCGDDVVIGEDAEDECDIIVTFGKTTAARASVRNIRGGAGADALTGDDRDNMIWGGAEVDTISGAEGNDTLYGQAGNDVMSGGAGNDYVNGGAGANALSGNDGLDTLDASEGTAASTADCGAGDGDISLVPSGGLTVGPASCELD